MLNKDTFKNLKQSTLETELGSTLENSSLQARPKSLMSYGGHQKKISINTKSNTSYDTRKINISTLESTCELKKPKKSVRCNTVNRSKLLYLLIIQYLAKAKSQSQNFYARIYMLNQSKNAYKNNEFANISEKSDKIMSYV